jgi:hypothetical protein
MATQVNIGAAAPNNHLQNIDARSRPPLFSQSLLSPLQLLLPFSAAIHFS